MIPEFNDMGNLPIGIHMASWEEIVSKYGYTERRKQLLKGLENAIIMLKDMGCKRIFLDGSFICNERNPGDYDVCWDDTGLDHMECLKICFTFFKHPDTQKQEFKGEFYPLSSIGILEYFQQDDTYSPKILKGIIELQIQ